MKLNYRRGTIFAAICLAGVILTWVNWIKISIWFGLKTLPNNYTNSNQLDNISGLGTFGDSFGSLNALFTGLACAGVLYTIFLQRAQIRIAQDGLNDAKYTEILRRFEVTFFHLLESFDTTASNIRFQGMRGLQGRDAIQAIIKDINDPLIPKIPYSGNRFYDKAQAKSHIDEKISMLYYNNTSSMGNYFHLLEIIIRSIDKARISDGDREIYLEILKGKISDAEITFILYFTMRAGSKVLRDYADKYNLFKRATGALLPQVVLELFNFRPNDP